MYDFYVVLGCFGLRIDDFVSCAGIENTILKVNNSLYNYKEMIEYFDCCRLFDRPMFDLNAIRHFIFNMNDRYDQVTKPLWTAKKFELYQKFVIDHRHCGLFVKLELPEDKIVTAEDESQKKVVMPHAVSSVKSSLPDGKLRLVRGRR